MELHNIKQLLEKYFEGETSLQEEKELKNYFSSENIAPELVQYQNMFGYFSKEKATESKIEIVLEKKSNSRKWLGMVASIVILLGIGFTFLKQPVQQDDLGTFDDPEIALIETQKALNLIAENLNKGKEKMYYLQEYENTKNRIFKN